MGRNHNVDRKGREVSRRKFLRNTAVLSVIGVGVTQTVVATPPTVEPEAHQTEFTLTETEGESIHYIIDVTGNSLEKAGKNETNDAITSNPSYMSVEGYLKDGTDKYTFGDSDQISRVLVEGDGNFEATLSGALDDAKNDVVIKAAQWGSSTDDPAVSYSFTSSDVVIRKSDLEDNDEIDSEGDTASGYIAPGNKDVWGTGGQFESIHVKPWGNELTMEVGDLPRGSSG